MKTIKIKQIKSSIKQPADQKRTLVALGLKRMNHTKDVLGTPQMLGMINKVSHLLKVEEIK